MDKECIHCGSYEGVICIERNRRWFFFSKGIKHRCLECGYIIEEDYSILKEEKKYHGGE